jgi:GDSL-like lipase/acylhydrolase family protein
MALAQAGWLDVTQDPSGQNLNSEAGQWWGMLCDSQNNHVARDGVMKGAKIRLTDVSPVAALGIAVVRKVTGNQYKVIGKSQEITSGLSVGVNEITFTNPIEKVQSDDCVCLLIKAEDGNSFAEYLDTDQTLPIDDSSTAKLRWYDTNSAAYSSIVVDSTYDFAGGGSAFAVLPLAALMKPPMVMVVGDSLAEGSPLNRSYRNDSTSKDREGAFAHITYRALGWSWELGGNTQGSNTLAEAMQYDLTDALWDKEPEYLHVHCGVNDIVDDRTWSQVESDLNNILAVCDSHSAKLMIDAIYPFTGKNDNTTGAHNQQVIREVWNQNLRNWALGRGVIYLDVNHVLGQERLTAKSGDPDPAAGNGWDLIDSYVYDDGLGVHLSKAGCAAAGAALAIAIQKRILAEVDIRAINGDETVVVSLQRSAAIRGNQAKQNKYTGELTIRNADDSADLLTVSFTDDGTNITRNIEST